MNQKSARELGNNSSIGRLSLREKLDAKGIIRVMPTETQTYIDANSRPLSVKKLTRNVLAVAIGSETDPEQELAAEKRADPLKQE